LLALAMPVLSSIVHLRPGRAPIVPPQDLALPRPVRITPEEGIPRTVVVRAGHVARGTMALLDV